MCEKEENKCTYDILGEIKIRIDYQGGLIMEFAKKFTALILVLLSLFMMTACSDPGDDQNNNQDTNNETETEDSKDEKISITIMGGAHLTSISEVVLRDYQKEHPEIEISFEKYSYAEYPTKQKVQLSSGESTPDILIAHNEFAIQYVEADWVLDISDIVDEDNLLPVLDVVEKDGKYYGLPDNCTTMYVYVYRSDIYDQYGLKAPTSFEEYLEQGLKLKEHGYYVGAYDPSQSSNSGVFSMYMQILGGKIFDEEGNAVFEKGEEALTLLKKAYDAGILHKSAPASSEEFWAAFNSGEIVAIPQGMGEVAYYETNLDPDGNGGYGELHMNPSFQMVDDGPKSATFYPDYFMINKNTKYPDECKELISYLAQSEEAALKYANVNEEGLMVRYGNAYIPGLQKIADGESLDGWESFGGQKVLSEAAEAMIDLQLKPNPVCDKSVEAVSIMDEILGEFFLNGTYDINGAIEAMRQQINNI